jgi:hypothetical protein
MSCAACTSGRRGSRAALARAATRASCKQQGGAQAGPQTRGATYHGVCQSRRPVWQLSLVNEAVHLIGSGETSGELEDMLERAAANQERELDGMLQALVGLLGPMMIVVMGVFVLAIVFAMLMPIFEMNTLVR